MYTASMVLCLVPSTSISQFQVISGNFPPFQPRHAKLVPQISANSLLRNKGLIKQCMINFGLPLDTPNDKEWDIPAIHARNICTCPSLDGRSIILIKVIWTLQEWCTYVFFILARSLRARIRTPSYIVLQSSMLQLVVSSCNKNSFPFFK